MRARYQIKMIQPTIALFFEDGRHVTRTVPAGAIINANTLEGNKLIEVQLAEQKARMFAQDIRDRGELLNINEAYVAEAPIDTQPPRCDHD